MCIYSYFFHHNDVIMSVMTSQLTGVSIGCSTVCSGVDQRKHQSSASLAFVRGIHRWTVDSPHKGQVTPVTRKMFPFDDVIMWFASGNHEGDTANNSACNLNNGLYKYRFMYACALCENNWLCYYVVSIAVPLFTYVGQIIYYRQKYGISGNTRI